MVSIERHTHSFIIKIWLEEEPREEHEGVWRGQITEVNTRERRYLHELSDIITYIKPYLEEWGVRA